MFFRTWYAISSSDPSYWLNLQAAAAQGGQENEEGSQMSKADGQEELALSFDISSSSSSVHSLVSAR